MGRRRVCARSAAARRYFPHPGGAAVRPRPRGWRPWSQSALLRRPATTAAWRARRRLSSGAWRMLMCRADARHINLCRRITSRANSKSCQSLGLVWQGAQTDKPAIADHQRHRQRIHAPCCAGCRCWLRCPAGFARQTAQRHNHRRLLPGDLLTQIRLTGEDFVALRIAVAWRPAPSTLAIYTSCSRSSPQRRQHIVQQLLPAGPTNGRPQIFLLAGASPTNSQRACGLPRANTVCVRVSHIAGNADRRRLRRAIVPIGPAARQRLAGRVGNCDRAGVIGKLGKYGRLGHRRGRGFDPRRLGSGWRQGGRLAPIPARR